MIIVKREDVEKKVTEITRERKQEAKAAAMLAYPQFSDQMLDPVRVPGIYEIYAIGTTGDVTIQVWMRNDGDAIVKWTSW